MEQKEANNPHSPTESAPEKYRIGVFVARFQTSMIHAAHAILINYIRNKNDRTVIVIGEAKTRLTQRNPLPAESRMQMIKDMYDTSNDLINLKDKIVDVISLDDEKYDEVWSNNLDKEIEKYIENHIFYKNKQAPIRGFNNFEITLYCGRDGFNQYYKGKHKVEEIDNIGIEHLSATEQRKQIHSRIKNSVEWREGVIYASAHRYPTSFQTVDIAILKEQEGKIELLLGRKKGESKYRFVGGFVDATDESLESAAKREVMEECDGIETDDYKYIGSAKINDWRYKNEKDSIMTALFVCKYIFGHPKATDDITEVKWFEIDSSKEFTIEIEDEHKPLMTMLLKKLWHKI